MANCEVCGAEYESKRADSRYCGPACRKAASRLSVTLSVTNAKCDKPLSVGRRCGPIPGDPDYSGVALQAKFASHWANPASVGFRPDDPAPSQVNARVLPAAVPDVIQACYLRWGPEYRATIHRLVDSDVPSLLALGVFVPVWRCYQLGVSCL